MPLRKRQVGFQQDEDDDDDDDDDNGNHHLETLNDSYTKLDKPSNSKHPPHTAAAAPSSPSPTTKKKKILGTAANFKSVSSWIVIINGWLQATTTFTSSAGNQDKALKTLQYTLWWIGRFYKPTTQAQRQALMMTMMTTLSGEISWARYVHRFFGLPAAIEAAGSGSWGSPTTYPYIGKSMAWSMMAYYPLEYLSYLKWKVPSTTTKNNNNNNNTEKENHRLASRASAWSCRFWFLYIVLDLMRSTCALQTKIKETTRDNNNKEEEDAKNILLQTRRSEQLQILRNVLFALPAIHWSLPKWDTDPWLSSDLLNGFMWLESIVCLYQGIDNYKASSTAAA